MQRLLSRRPSPSMVVALAALFISLGGVSYGAAVVITGKSIKNNTVGTKDLKNNDIRGGDVRNNSLTGSDVNESKLGKVPSATSADNAASAKTATTATNATTAGTAGTVGGLTLRKISLVAPAGTTGRTLLNLKGLLITADCSVGGLPDNIDVTVPAGSDVTVWGFDADGAANPVASDALDIENFGGGTLQNIEDTIGDASANSVGAQLDYVRNNGDVVTAQFYMDFTTVPGQECAIGGTAIG